MAVNPLAIGGGVVATAAIVGGGLYAGGVFSGGDKNSGNTGGGNSGIVKEYRGPAWKSASNDTDASSAYSNNTYASKYKKYLVGVNPTTSNANDTWWKWSFDNRYTKATKTESKGFASGITDETKLKEACQKAYKGSISGTEGEITETGGTSTKFPEKEV